MRWAERDPAVVKPRPRLGLILNPARRFRLGRKSINLFARHVRQRCADIVVIADLVPAMAFKEYAKDE